MTRCLWFLILAAGVAPVGRGDDKKADDKKSPAAEAAAKVFEKANKAKSVKMAIKSGEDGKAVEEATFLYRRDLGVRMEQRDPKTGDPTTIAVGSVKDEKTVILDVKAKTATVRRFTEQQMAGEGPIPTRVKATANVTAGKDEKVGDRPVKVFEGVSQGVTGGVWTMWADPQTDLPVRLRMEKPGPNGKVVTMEIEYSDWDKEFNAKLFAATVPDGYKVAEPPKKE
jgi:outer membrane lipoprotein-sorting protein